MKIYVSRRDENVTAKLDEAYTNKQTVMLEYLTGDKVGKTTSITHSTLKRWWKAVEVEEVKEEDTYLEEELIYTVEDAKAFNKLSKVEKIELSTEEHELVPMPGIEKLEVYKNEVELESVITKLQDAGFTVNIVKGLSKTISIKTVGQLAISKNGFRLKANLNFEFTSETSYETTKNYNKVMCDTLEDVLKIIQ